MRREEDANGKTESYKTWAAWDKRKKRFAVVGFDDEAAASEWSEAGGPDFEVVRVRVTIEEISSD